MGSDEKTGEEAKQKVWELIKDINVALFTTQDTQGKLHARPMVALHYNRFEGELWFFTHIDSPKTQEIRSNQHVLLAYSKPEHQHYVSIGGRAEIVNDREKIYEYWSEFARPWFPKGPDDPAVTLIRVRVDYAQYWDAPSNAMVYAYGYLKARLTGEPPKNIADTGKLNFNVA